MRDTDRERRRGLFQRNSGFATAHNLARFRSRRCTVVGCRELAQRSALECLQRGVGGSSPSAPTTVEHGGIALLAMLGIDAHVDVSALIPEFIEDTSTAATPRWSSRTTRVAALRSRGEGALRSRRGSRLAVRRRSLNAPQQPRRLTSRVPPQMPKSMTFVIASLRHDSRTGQPAQTGRPRSKARQIRPSAFSNAATPVPSQSLGRDGRHPRRVRPGLPELALATRFGRLGHPRERAPPNRSRRAHPEPGHSESRSPPFCSSPW
jgi:hypothetical protein